MYAIEIYGHATKTEIKKLQTIQNKVLRALFGIDRKHHTELMYRELGVPTVDTLFRFRSLLMFFQLIRQKVQHTSSLSIHSVLSSYCTQMTHKYHTREKSNVDLKFNRASFTSSSSFKLFLLWNSLPVDIKTAEAYASFKKLLYEHVMLSKWKLSGKSHSA